MAKSTGRLISAIRKNAMGSPAILEINPVSGGARRRPKKPMVEISAIAIPEGISLQRPVSPQHNGTIALVPTPTIANPMRVIAMVQKGSKVAPTMQKSPRVIALAQMKRMRKSPSRLTKRSMTKRPVTMVQR